MRSKLTCICGNFVTIEGTSNVGEMEDRSGFSAVFTHGGGLSFLCPSCKKKVLPAVQAIVEVFGEEKAKDLSWYALWRSVTR